MLKASILTLFATKILLTTAFSEVSAKEFFGHSLIEQAAVVVTTRNAKNQVSNGVVVSSLGHVLTTNHSLGTSTRFSVSTGDGRHHRATVVYRSSNKDLALLKIASNLPWRYVPIGSTPKFKDETLVFTRNVRHPDQYKKTKTRVSLSNINLYFDEETTTMSPIMASAIMLNKRFEKGQSGSGLYNQQGQLVGIMVSSVDKRNKKPRALAVSANQINPILKLELAGYFKSDREKTRWILDGLIASVVASGKGTRSELESVKNSVLKEIFDNPANRSLDWFQKSDMAWSAFMKMARK